MPNVLDTLIYGYRAVKVAGVSRPARGTLNFISGFSIVDNDTTGETEITGIAAAMSIPGQVTGDLVYYNGTSWVRRAIGSTGNVLSVVAGLPTWSALNLAGGAAYVSGVLPAANQASQTLAGDATGTTGAAAVVAITGSAGVASLKCARVDWASGAVAYRGTESYEGQLTTSSAAANQTAQTIVIPADALRCFTVNLTGRDTTAAGFYAGSLRDCFERRTGVSGGVPVRQGSVPAVGGEIRTGTLAGATFDLSVSGNDVLLRISPGVANSTHWTWELVALRNGVVV
jgi:hypothetical protein